MASGYWPATADNNNFYLFCRDLLMLWYHLQHKSPSISSKAVLEILGKLSEDNNRVKRLNEILINTRLHFFFIQCPTIDPTLFAMAAREFEYHLYRLDTDVKRINNMKCRACGNQPLFCHCDANVKCYRFKNAGE